MKTRFTTALVFTTVFFNTQVFAYNSGKNADETCKPPRFERFSLPEYNASEKIEVPPEAEFTFTLSPKADPTTLKITAKKKPLEVEIIKKTSFYLVKGKIPAEYTGKYVRINVQVKAKLECKGLGGWLVKVADKTVTPETPAPVPAIENEVTPEVQETVSE